MDPCDNAPPYIRRIAPYQPGKPISELARELGLQESEIIKLASNENPLGVSPRAAVAIPRAIAELSRYPDGSGYELKQALSRKLGIVRSNRLQHGSGTKLSPLASQDIFAEQVPRAGPPFSAEAGWEIDLRGMCSAMSWVVWVLIGAVSLRAGVGLLVLWRSTLQGRTKGASASLGVKDSA